MNGAVDPSPRPELPPRTEKLLACFQKALGHEMLNHLTAIQGLVRVLELDAAAQLDVESRELLDRLTGAVKRMHALVKALAELARVDREAAPVEPICLAEAAEEAAAEVCQLFPGRGIDFRFPDRGPVVAVARKSLRQILVHLLRNAVQAVPPERQPIIEIGVLARGNELHFSVADNGRGLSAHRLTELFEPFTGYDPLAPGAGLGLFLVRHLVEGWGGVIQAQSELDKGTTFTIRLPGPPPARA